MEYSAASCGGLIETGQCIGCRLAVDEVRRTPNTQSELFQGELTIILSNLECSMQKVKAELSTSVGGGSGVWPGLLVHVEAFLDAGDAVKRRKQATRSTGILPRSASAMSVPRWNCRPWPSARRVAGCSAAVAVSSIPCVL